MNRMLMTVAEMAKLGVTSFDKWPGYEQQYDSKRPKQVRNTGWEKNGIAPRKRQTHIWHQSHQKQSLEKRGESLEEDLLVAA